MWHNFPKFGSMKVHEQLVFNNLNWIIKHYIMISYSAWFVWVIMQQARLSEQLKMKWKPSCLNNFAFKTISSCIPAWLVVNHQWVHSLGPEQAMFPVTPRLHPGPRHLAVDRGSPRRGRGASKPTRAVLGTSLNKGICVLAWSKITFMSLNLLLGKLYTVLGKRRVHKNPLGLYIT